MENRIISFSPPDISEFEIKEVVEALRSGWITTGPRTKELEKRLAEFCHIDNMVCLNSATAAAELNFRILGIKPGDEVIVPAYTYTASASAAIHVGATVIFVDSQKNGDMITGSPEMDYDAMEKVITKRTKAIVPVDIAGIVCNYERIYQALENKKHLFTPESSVQQEIGRVAIVSDCAHSFGAKKNGKMAGTSSDFASYSFHAVKNFTTAEGGAATWNIPGIDRDELYKKYQLYSLHGQSKDALSKTKLGAWEYDILGPWYKCNMTDIMAAIGLRQLDRYPELLSKRKEIIEGYDIMCDELGIFRLKHYGEDYSSSGHLYLVRIPNIKIEQRDKIIEKLAERGIAANVHYKPLPMMSAYKSLGWNISDFPNAYDYYHNLITLPLHTQLSVEDLEYVIVNFKRIVKEYISK